MIDRPSQPPVHVSPNEGLPSEHSAYYRRLLSAGYKGHIQGGIGGATLYGVFGLAIGALVGIPLMIFAPVTIGAAALALIPTLGGLGALEGAKTFADIGSHAAITADSAEINEKRRYLLDRLRDSEDPVEKAELTRALNEQLAPQPIHQLFHWKPALLGAVLGGALAVAAVFVAPHVVLLESIVGTLSGVGISITAMPVLAGVVGGAIGMLSGAVIGTDREYVRHWLDKSETLVSSYTDNERETIARAQDAKLIQQLAAEPAPHRPAREMVMPDAVTKPNAAPTIPSQSLAPATTLNMAEIKGRLAKSPELNVAAG